MPVPPDIAKRLRRTTSRLLAASAIELERNRLIIEAHEAGASLREIAKEAGLTHVAVKRIIDR